ncbi:hypothetical protein N300_04201, partial [Calypte anna]
SLQTLELTAVIWVFEKWNNVAVNIVSDSLYVVGIVLRMYHAVLKEISNKHLYFLLQKLLRLLAEREHPYFITHIRSHLSDRGLAIGNNRADYLVAPAWTGPSVDVFSQARQSHAFFHQSAKVLAKQFHLPLGDAQGIVKSCPDCQKVDLGIGMGDNPKGLKSLELWQMAVTHVQQFGCLKYVHVVIDTFSMVIWASAQIGEATKHVMRHLYVSFAVLGVPQSIKTDNGPAYSSAHFRQFCGQWGIRHVAGIPHNPTGQAIVEPCHSVLNALLEKQ